MKNFNFGNRSRDRRSSSRRDFSGRDSMRSSLHDAVCDECGKDCQVPFKPRGDKPIYCSDCFEKKGGRDSNRSNWKGSSDRSISQLIEKIEILNTKLETIINLLSSTGEKKSGLEDRAKKNKKSKSTKEDKNTEACPIV